MEHFVYELVDPRTDKVKYVGITANPNIRLYQHVKAHWGATDQPDGHAGTVMRVPVWQIRDVLQSLHGCEVSIGEITEVLHRLVEHARPVLDDLKTTIRVSPAVQADETGWREDGLNGSIWSVCTPTIRYYEYHVLPCRRDREAVDRRTLPGGARK